MMNLESKLNSLTLEHSPLQQELLQQQEQQQHEDGLIPASVCRGVHTPYLAAIAAAAAAA